MSSRLLVVFTLVPLSAFAWDSVCFEPNGRACTPSAGPQTARHRWIGPSDEHRQLFEQTREQAGLPASVSMPTTLTPLAHEACMASRAVTPSSPAP